MSRTIAGRLAMMRKRAETTRDRIARHDYVPSGDMDDLLLAEEVLQYLDAIHAAEVAERGKDA